MNKLIPLNKRLIPLSAKKLIREKSITAKEKTKICLMSPKYSKPAWCPCKISTSGR